MALLNFSKKKKAEEPKKDVAEKAAEAPKAAKTAKLAKEAKAGFSYDIVKEPHISEKGSYLAEANQYIFRVAPQANKSEVGKAIKGIYGVDVLSVNMIKIPAKKRRVGKTQGFRKAYKKAVVTIKEGQKIEIL